MDFGISLDASAVPQRHLLEDSDADEDDEVSVGTDREQIFTSPDVGSGGATTGENLIIAIGQSASIFVKSHLSLEPVPAFAVQTDSHTVFQSWPRNTRRSTYTVSEGFKVCCKNPEQENFLACTHEELLNTLQCNSWCAKVSVYLHRHNQCSSMGGSCILSKVYQFKGLLQEMPEAFDKLVCQITTDTSLVVVSLSGTKIKRFDLWCYMLLGYQLHWGGGGGS